MTQPSGIRAAFAGFDPKVVARFGKRDVERLVKDEGIVRSRAKILAAIGNARAYLAMEATGEDFSAFAWGFVGGRPIVNATWKVPAKSPLSEQVSRELKRRGFKFVGPVSVYAWMQAAGLVNDHAPDCFRRRAVGRQRG